MRIARTVGPTLIPPPFLRVIAERSKEPPDRPHDRIGTSQSRHDEHAVSIANRIAGIRNHVTGRKKSAISRAVLESGGGVILFMPSLIRR
jgi:hypothetical protein